MIRSLYTSVSALITLENKQNVISNNMANANTNGFKSDSLSMKSFNEVYISNKDKVVGGRNVRNTIGTLSLGASIDGVNTHFSQGVLKETSKETDFSIDGRGFFVVQRNTGTGVENLYTRDGNFKVGTDGCLMTTDGDKVLGRNLSNGTVEPIFVGNSNFTLNDNIIEVEGFDNYEMLTADFEDYTSLEKVGDNYYSGENPVMNAEVAVKQGYIETSNVSLTDEMVNMMTTLRSFETNQSIVKMLDNTLSKAANEIGRV